MNPLPPPTPFDKAAFCGAIAALHTHPGALSSPASSSPSPSVLMHQTHLLQQQQQQHQQHIQQRQLQQQQLAALQHQLAYQRQLQQMQQQHQLAAVAAAPPLPVAAAPPPPPPARTPLKLLPRGSSSSGGAPEEAQPKDKHSPFGGARPREEVLAERGLDGARSPSLSPSLSLSLSARLGSAASSGGGGAFSPGGGGGGGGRVFSTSAGDAGEAWHTVDRKGRFALLEPVAAGAPGAPSPQPTAAPRGGGGHGLAPRRSLGAGAGGPARRRGNYGSDSDDGGDGLCKRPLPRRSAEADVFSFML